MTTPSNKRKHDDVGQASVTPPPTSETKKPAVFNVFILFKITNQPAADDAGSDAMKTRLENEKLNQRALDFFEGSHTISDKNGEFDLRLCVVNADRNLLGVRGLLSPVFIKLGMESLVQQFYEKEKCRPKFTIDFMISEVCCTTRPLIDFFSS